MIAPVVEEGATGRKVYLPEEMMEVRFNGEEFTTEVCEPGWRQIEVPLNEVVFYIRKDHAIVVARKQVQTTMEMDIQDVETLGFNVEYDHYFDDGISKLQ